MNSYIPNIYSGENNETESKNILDKCNNINYDFFS